MKPRKMKSQMAWACVDKETGVVVDVQFTREEARYIKLESDRIVRVRVTEAP